MTNVDLARRRLLNQHIAAATVETPRDVVAWLGAVQAQDYGAAKWALGLRVPGVTEAAIEQAFTEGAILRTHLLRPTWHLVTPADIRWLLALTAPRVHALNAYYYRQHELDAATFAQAATALTRALQGGHALTRVELAAVFGRAGIVADTGLRLGLLLMHAELEGLLCSGPRRGKQFTYALLDERAPAARVPAHDEALAMLAGRYFASHGPATVRDFVWWSGLTAADARAGLALVSSQLAQQVIDGQTYWVSQQTPPARATSQPVYLLPSFDEYLVGYTDRSAVVDPAHAQELGWPDNLLLSHVLLGDGLLVGSWKRTLKTRDVYLEVDLFTPVSAAETAALAAAAARYATFLNRPLAGLAYTSW